jgi:tetratricopeptide (TPR) repeat protein
MPSRLLGILLGLLLAGVPLRGDDQHKHSGEAANLGTVNFPISCSEDSQKAFTRGVGLLHSFWYEEATKAFRELEHRDSHCAMAYWGEAMSLYHPLWEHPSEETLKRGRSALKKAAKLTATPREREYISALATFYRDSKKQAHAARAAAYAKEMEKVSANYPDDHEAATFYALALLGSKPQHDTEFIERKKAAAVLELVFAVEPNHPGVAHYLIHSYDRPQLAAMGLEAALRYAKIAPDAPHALHMPSHIFNRLGLWEDSVASNLASVAATRKSAAMHMGEVSHQLHAMDFLDYAYLQTGREDQAVALLDEVRSLRGLEEDEMSYMLAVVPARHALEMRDWKAAAALEPPSGGSPDTQAITQWARAIGAARSGNLPTAREAVAKLKAIQASLESGHHGYGADSVKLALQEAEAWLAHAEGNDSHAIDVLHAAAESEDSFGAEQVSIPAREMLADLLLEAKRPAEALAEYQVAMRFAPNRFNGLAGAAQAAEQAGDVKQAASYWARLVDVCKGSDSSRRPELARARQLVAQK